MFYLRNKVEGSGICVSAQKPDPLTVASSPRRSTFTMSIADVLRVLSVVATENGVLPGKIYPKKCVLGHVFG
jgi:hypothetical protein